MHAWTALLLSLCFYAVLADVDIITEPRPGEEYVLVSSGQQTPLRNFESSHKIPEKHPNHRIIKQDENNEKIIKKLHSGKVKYPSEGIISIEEDKKALFKKGQKNKATESIEIDVPVSKLEDIKIKENVKDVETNPKLAVALEAMSESGKLSNKAATTTQKPVLTTEAAHINKGYEYIPINFDTIDDINSGLLSSNIKLETAGSEQKQHSRIQVKKGPNGQDYEYEYIYYYYDEDEDTKKEGNDKTVTTTTEKVTESTLNSHDGPAKVETENQISRDSKRSKYSTIDRSSATTAPTATVQNEVLPTASRGRSRGRNISPAPVDEEIEDERLPSSTRFPPRGRNLAAGTSTTTQAPETTSETIKHRGRPQSDSVADESSGQTRSRARAHIRRPSSELVDLDSFKTQTRDIPSQYKDAPTRYSYETKSATEATEEPSAPKDAAREGHSLSGNIRFQEILDDSKLPADYKQTTTYELETTEYTTMTAMEKVALDLYAYLAGENLNNEVSATSDTLGFDGSTTVDDEGWTTESISTTEEDTTTSTTTTSTTTTTTTTTTPAPTTTTTTTAAPSTRPSRFKGRPGIRGRASVATSAATEAPQETSTKARGRFGKPNGGRKTTAASASEATPAPSAEKPSAQPKPFGRRGLFAGRTRPSSTTSAPALDASYAPTEVSAPRARLRPGLRRGTTAASTTAVPTSAAGGSSAEETTGPSAGSGEIAETTVAPVRTIGRRPGQLRPVPSLRPGPRLNLRPSARARPGLVSAAPSDTAETPAAETSAADASVTPAADAETEISPATPAPEQARGGLKIRNRLQVSPSPKPRAAVTPPARRVNPLLKRKQATEATTEAIKKVVTETTEDSTSAERSETETEAQPAETTPAPPLRGLDALIARRRAAGIGGRIARPARGARN